QTARKDSANPFFKSVYADLASVWEACRQALSTNGLCVIQTTDNDNGSVIVITTLIHSSGQWIRGKLRIKPVKDDPQGIGSAITYARRYALAAIVGVAPDEGEDDDGEGAMGRGKGKKPTTLQEPKKRLTATDEAPLGDPSSGLLHITQNIASVTIRNKRNIITDGNKVEYATFSNTLAATAKRAMEAGIRAELGYTVNQYGNALETIVLVENPGEKTPMPESLMCPDDPSLPAAPFACAQCEKNKDCEIAKKAVTA
ncbi:MAG: ERF family protein, partial [Ignavibacteria bacterium]|nr:ERF family protein [Ignavibacteria bacterium]